MRLRNQFMLLMIIIVAVAAIAIALFSGSPDILSPGGHSLDRLLVRTQALVYHDQDAFYDSHYASRIDDPQTVATVIKLLGNINCRKKPLAADDDFLTIATHRLCFSGSGVTIYLDAEHGAVWYEYSKDVPIRQRFGYSDDVTQPNTALIYQIKDSQKLSEVIELLDQAAESAQAVEYVYSLLTADGTRGEFSIFGSDGGNSDALTEAGTTQDSIKLSFGSRQQIRFVLRDRNFDGDEISVLALAPLSGGLRPMSSQIDYDYQRAGRNDIQLPLVWDEQYQPIRFAGFRIMVVDEEFSAAAEKLLADFNEQTIREYLPYLGIEEAEIEQQMNYALINDGELFYYLMQNGELRPIVEVYETASYEVVSSDYFTVTSVRTNAANGYRSFPAKRGYSYDGHQFQEIILADYQEISAETVTGYDVKAELVDINFTEMGIDLSFTTQDKGEARVFPYIEASFSNAWNTGQLRLKNTILSSELEVYGYSRDSRISNYFAQEDGDDIIIKVTLGSWRWDYYHLAARADDDSTAYLANPTVALKLNDVVAIDADLSQYQPD